MLQSNLIAAPSDLNNYPEPRMVLGIQRKKGNRMASCISYKDQFIWVSNRRFDAMIEFVIEVGEQTAKLPEEHAMVERLRGASDAFFPGYDFQLEKEFASLAEQKFWAKCFYDLARTIFLRKIGKHEVDFWQSSAIGEAYVIARLLVQAAREVEPGWHPSTEDSLLAEEFYGRITNIRL